MRVRAKIFPPKVGAKGSGCATSGHRSVGRVQKVCYVVRRRHKCAVSKLRRRNVKRLVFDQLVWFSAALTHQILHTGKYRIPLWSFWCMLWRNKSAILTSNWVLQVTAWSHVFPTRSGMASGKRWINMVVCCWKYHRQLSSSAKQQQCQTSWIV